MHPWTAVTQRCTSCQYWNNGHLNNSQTVLYNQRLMGWLITWAWIHLWIKCFLLEKWKLGFCASYTYNTIYLTGSYWTEGWQRWPRSRGLCREGKFELFCRVNKAVSYHDDTPPICVVSLLLPCVQGEKGEPGLIVGPDGNPLYLAGLTGPKVSPIQLSPFISVWSHQLPPLLVCYVMLTFVFKTNRLCFISVGRQRSPRTCWTLCTCLCFQDF